MSHGDRLFAGFDGGGSKTKAIVIDSVGKTVYETHGSSSNIATLGVDGTLARLLPMLEDIERHCSGYSAAASAVTFGLAGVVDADRENTRSLIRDLKERLPGQVVNVVNDGHIAWYAGHQGKPGIAIICGTGSTCYGVDDNGDVVVRGGMGHLLSDDGSGYQIGIRGIRSAVRAHSGIGPDTLLCDALQTEFSLQRFDEAPHRIQDRQEIAAFARNVYEASTVGDPVSIGIIEQAATDLANLVKAVWRSGSFPRSAVRVATVGGCFNNMSGLREAFCRYLTDKPGRFDVRESHWPPERGAAELARQNTPEPGHLTV